MVRTTKTNIFLEREKKTDIKTKIKRRFSFSLKKTKSGSKRALTPMRRRESKGADSLTSEESASLEQLDCEKTVCFAREGRSKTKVKGQVYKFEKVSPEEAHRLWYTENDMANIVEDVKVVVRHYQKRCGRYKTVMDRVQMHCKTAPQHMDSVTSQLDARVLEQLADADARGLEHHILDPLLTPPVANGEAPATSESNRKEILREVLRCQAAHSKSSPEVREQAIAKVYAKRAHSAKLMAKTMADGDALVVANAAA